MFTHKETRYGDDELELTTVHGVVLGFLFDSAQNCTHIYIDGDEFPAMSDAFNGLFVSIGKRGFDIDAKLYSIEQLRQMAVSGFPDIKKEIDQNAQEQSDMERELSCPRMTDRI